MFNLVQELGYDIIEENYIKDLQEMLVESENKVLSLYKKDNDLFTLECNLNKVVRDHQVSIHVCIEFDKKMLYRVKLDLEPLDSDDKLNYELDLKLFFHEEIKGRLLDSINKKKSKFTLRNYKIIYNSSPINGYYEINGDNKISFHSLNITPKDEPLTEHILCFDVEVEERNFERARSLANNTVSEFCCFLSLLLDIGFYEPTSKFMNFITTKYVGVQKVFSNERYRTAFYDPELELYIKDNMNGLCSKKDIIKGNFNNGYYSLGAMDGTSMVQMSMGELSSIEDVFSNHRLYKTKDKVKKTDDYIEEINVEPHFPNQPIYIPRQIRKYFRGIENYKKNRYENYQCFRNACRLYNKSKTLGMEGASIEISFLVASLEALSKTESNSSFTTFVMKYNPDAKKEDLDSLYGIRSKLFHSGAFSFFEFEFDVNPYSNPFYMEFHQKYILFKIILRKAFINWINEYLVDS